MLNLVDPPAALGRFRCPHWEAGVEGGRHRSAQCKGVHLELKGGRPNFVEPIEVDQCMGLVNLYRFARCRKMQTKRKRPNAPLAGDP